ncbi:MAG TPA: hypothetical protein PK156_35180 [Polyangium sp.]|nr:hypothetical protein [Polyangium sp.]
MVEVERRFFRAPSRRQSAELADPNDLGHRSDTAVWLTEHVIPTVQIRQWVCTSLALRVRAGYDRELWAMVRDTFVRELRRSYRWRAKRELGLSNVHYYTLVFDAVDVKNKNGEGLARWYSFRAARSV